MPEPELHVETHEDLPLGRDAVVRHGVLRFGKEVERRPAREPPYLPHPETERDVVRVLLEVEGPGGATPEVEALREVVDDGRTAGSSGVMESRRALEPCTPPPRERVGSIKGSHRHPPASWGVT